VFIQDEDGSTMEYREWDPFKSRFAAAILSDAQDISIVSFPNYYYASFKDLHFVLTQEFLVEIVPFILHSNIYKNKMITDWFMFCRNPVHVYSC
jgi:hypothetical protein